MDKLDKKWNEIAPHAKKGFGNNGKKKEILSQATYRRALSKKQRVTTNCTVLNLVITVNFTIKFSFFLQMMMVIFAGMQQLQLLKYQANVMNPGPVWRSPMI